MFCAIYLKSVGFAIVRRISTNIVFSKLGDKALINNDVDCFVMGEPMKIVILFIVNLCLMAKQ